MNQNIMHLLEDCIAMELEEASHVGKRGYICRCLVMATMPHRDLKRNEFSRMAGAFRLNMISPGHIGLPYGTKPRLIMAFISRQAVIKKSPIINLGKNLSDFLHQLGLDSSGRTSALVKDQMNRLFNTTISYNENYKNNCQRSGRFNISKEEKFFWNKVHHSENVEQLWNTQITLTSDFYEEIIKNPVSLDLRALQALKSSSLGLDIYSWLTFRMSYLNEPIIIPWPYLMMQFGSEYQNIKHFKEKFLLQLRKVCVCYPGASVYPLEEGFQLFPSPTHVQNKTNSYPQNFVDN